MDLFLIISCRPNSLLVFEGRYAAVLINYPNQEGKKKII